MSLDLKVEQIDEAIQRGLHYLIEQNKGEYWQGFPTLAGTSDIWVTGFILTHVQNLIWDKQLVQRSLNFLVNSMRKNGGWSYSGQVPSDADSTAWCMMALSSSQLSDTLNLDRSKDFLWSHYQSEGIATYKVDGGISEYISLPDLTLIKGWTSAHIDVTVAAILADINSNRAKELFDKLTLKLDTMGYLPCYWWRVPGYATTLLLRALDIKNQILDANTLKLITDQIISYQTVDGGFSLDNSESMDNFSSAIALEILMRLKYAAVYDQINKCAMALLEAQGTNGSWEGGHILRIPAPYIIDPEEVSVWNSDTGGGNSFIKDDNGLFSTTMSIYALNFLKKLVQKE